MPSLSYCAQQVRRHDNDRFLCALFAPAERREALFALYAFDLELAAIPGKVSEPLLGMMRFQWWREAVDGKTVAHQVVGPLVQAVTGTGLDKADLHRLIDARAADLDDTPIASLAALGTHTAGTAGALGEMALDVLGIDDKAAREAARHVGQAQAGVAILLSLADHSGRWRCRLPADLMRAAGLNPDAALADAPSGALRRVIAEVADWIGRHLSAARLNRGNMPREALPALLPAALVDLHLERLQRRNFDPFHPDLWRPAPLRVLRLWWLARRNRF